MVTHDDRGLLQRGRAHKSMLSDSNWLLELPFLTVKLLRKLTGIRDVPGILGGFSKMASS
jgi:hypothetical protein